MLFFIGRFAYYLSLFIAFMGVAVGLAFAIQYFNPLWVGVGMVVSVAALMAYLDWRTRK